MRPLLFAVSALVLSACAASPEHAEGPMRVETVRLEPKEDLSLRAGDYVDSSGFSFDIGFPEDAADLSAPDSVTWTIGFKNYCRNRDSWVQSVVVGPAGQVWRGYRVFVPAGPEHRQYWSSGGNGADAYGGPATPGILEAAARGGRFMLAIEDDEGQRWNAVMINTLTPAARNKLFAAQSEYAPREPQMFTSRIVPPVAPDSPRTCP